MKFNALILGPTGTGKTYSLRTLLPFVRRLVILTTEPGVEHILGDTDKTKVAWHYIATATTDWSILKDQADKVNRLSNDQLAKQVGINQDNYRQFIEVLETCSNFKDDRTGIALGPVDEFPEDWCFVIDNMTGLSQMVLDLIVGAKPIKSLPDYLVAQDTLERFILKCIGDTRCSFILLSHMGRERDEIRGGTNLTVQTIGQKLAPKLPPRFDEVILAERKGTEFSWSTAAPDADLKTRLLPIKDGLPQNFSLLFESMKRKWKDEVANS